MPRILQAFQRVATATACDRAQESASFIEIGARGTPIDASPDVLAAGEKTTPSKEDVEEVLVEQPEAGALTLRLFPALGGTGPHAPAFAPEIVTYHDPLLPRSREYALVGAETIKQLTALTCKTVLWCSTPELKHAVVPFLNLAVMMTKASDANTVLIDARDEDPDMASRVGYFKVAGLSDVLVGAASLAQVIQNTPLENMQLLSRGTLDLSKPLLASPSVSSILRHLLCQWHRVLILGGPWDGSPGLVAMGALVDAVYLMHGDGDELTDLTRVMQLQGARLRGTLSLAA